MKQRQRKRALYARAYGPLDAFLKARRRRELLQERLGRKLLAWLREQFSTYDEALEWTAQWVKDGQPENFVTRRVAWCTRRVMASLVSDALEGLEVPTWRWFVYTRYGAQLYSLDFDESE